VYVATIFSLIPPVRCFASEGILKVLET